MEVESQQQQRTTNVQSLSTNDQAVLNFLFKVENDQDADSQSPNNNNEHGNEESVVDKEYINSIAQSGIDVKEHIASLKKELSAKEEHLIDNHVANSTQLAELYTHVKGSDAILQNMESLLNGFQSDLAQLSNDIQALQEISIGKSVKLKNRLAAKAAMGTVIEGILLTPQEIKLLCEGDLHGDLYLHTLIELNRKMNYVKSHSHNHIRAYKDIGPVMEKLRLKATERIRHFLLERLQQLGSQNTNAPVVQKMLLNFRAYNHFISMRHHEASTEIRLTYEYLMQQYYSARFGKYVSRLQKTLVTVGDKTELIGSDDGQSGLNLKKALMVATGKGTSALSNMAGKISPFILGDRVKQLTSMDSPVIIPHVAEEQNAKYLVEAVFRSVCRTLLDNASSEYSFITEFFRPPDSFTQGHYNGKQLVQEIFQQVFGKSIKSVQEMISTIVMNSFDAVGLLLCIRITAQCQIIMQNRRIPALDSFLNGVNLLLWPRFQYVVDQHIASIKKIPSSLPEAKLNLVMRRYSDFAESISALNENSADMFVNNTMNRLKSEIDLLMSKN
ncbi:hypothetical protein MIR68_009678 [Amoeboaphelidium protococcarum]|nr:hypothetical protein MIR68_009678 [Amoeboaphelidium protococcarum]